MKYRSLWWIVAGVLALVTGYVIMATIPDKSSNEEEQKVRLGLVNSPGELATRIDSLFSAATEHELDLLVAAPDCTVALASGWEGVRRTLPKERQQKIVSPDREAISRFLELVGRRTRFPIPGIWEASVKNAKSYGRDNIWFPLPKTVEKSAGVAAPVVLLRREGDQWIVKKGSQTVTLPAEDGRGPVDKATVAMTDETVYVALHAWPPTPYKLYAIERSSGKIIWSSLVWADGGFMNYSGQGWHVVELRLAGDKLAVFGVSTGTAYIEVFDRRTGENQYRFGTSYFRATE